MISQMIVGVGHRHIEHDSLEQLHQILFGLRSVGAEEGYQLQIAGSVIAGCTVHLTQHGHGGSKMDAAFPITVKPLYQEGTAQLGEGFQPGFRHIQTAHSCQIVGHLFPGTGVVVIVLGREFCDPQGAIHGLHGGFRSGTTEGRTGTDQLTEPLLFQSILVLLELPGSLLQRSKGRPGRSCCLLIIGQERAIVIQTEPDGTHTGLIVDTQQVIAIQ